MSAVVQSNKIDRGTDALKTHVSGCQKMSIRQSRKGWCQECLGCEATTEFRYFKAGESDQFAHSLEESGCFCRICCTPCHPFTMAVKEMNTEAELLTVERPCACAAGACKCCCYQQISVTSGGEPIGSIKEVCYWCVPQFNAYDENGGEIYKIHPPTCCGGCCINCCAEGNPCCGKGCCKVPFHVFPASQEKTDGDAPYIGKILKKPKSAATEVFTDANAFDVTFPEGASSGEKALLIGGAIFLNAAFFEGGDQ